MNSTATDTSSAYPDVFKEDLVGQKQQGKGFGGGGKIDCLYEGARIAQTSVSCTRLCLMSISVCLS